MMIRPYYRVVCFFVLIIFLSCSPSESTKDRKNRTNVSPSKMMVQKSKKEKGEDSFLELNQTQVDTILPGFFSYGEIIGDLNQDKVDDRIVILKGTDSTMMVEHEYRGTLDRNRRGLLIYLGRNNQWDLILKNVDCFSSENEDGGVYYAPELSVEIKNGNIYIAYHHGRYGNWVYTFRFKENDFELIGYDASENFGPIVNSEISINFLTKKKLTRKNVNRDADLEEEEIFEDTWSKIKLDKRLKLSEIKDFDQLTMDY